MYAAYLPLFDRTFELLLKNLFCGGASCPHFHNLTVGKNVKSIYNHKALHLAEHKA